MSGERRASMIGALGLAGTALAWVAAPASFPHAWLAAVAAWSGWPLGGLAPILTHSLTGGRWGEALRPGLLAGVATMPLLLPLILPVLLSLPALYPWARPAAGLPNA